ncbi:hypothetical protein R3W88_014614 [Solanum pinnatisectum]|uniref:Tf2-1-like SH3-like domain-containing protein n=1 Tax=Solanum pinnatisectum TaxID=50273 RepID=A0AAV9KS66_9SOLN|nr:hypothetical protein R3W88_014614 [Solanum pinnatisectum]
MRFGKKGKLSPRFTVPYRILRRVGRVAYELELPSGLESIHPVFHVSMLQKCVGDPSWVVLVEDVQITKELSYEETLFAILDRQVRKLRIKEVASVKVLKSLGIIFPMPPSMSNSKFLWDRGSVLSYSCFALVCLALDTLSLLYIVGALEEP